MPKVKKPNTTIENVLCTDGKLYLPPCQIRCPLDEDIQKTMQ